MKKRLAWLVLGILFVFGNLAWAQPKLPPTPTSSIYVQDYAGVLSSDTKTKINSVGSNLAAKTKAQIVAVTVKSTEEMAIEDYALAVLRQWGLGDKTLNNGVVLLVSVGDRQSRIEVGYGLEGALPDSKTGRLQDEYMLPYFQKGDYDQGILNCYLALAGEVAKEYKVDVKTDAKPAARTQHTRDNASWWSSLPWWAHIMIGAGLLLLFLMDWVFWGGTITLLLLSLLRFRGGGGGGGGGYGGGSGGGGGSSRRW